MPPRPSLSGRRGGLALLLCAALVAASGCDALEEPPDDSLRGAGSIDVPSADLRFRPTPSEPEEPWPAEPGL